MRTRPDPPSPPTNGEANGPPPPPLPVPPAPGIARPVPGWSGDAVSYTHLTLPTIYSV